VDPFEVTLPLIAEFLMSLFTRNIKIGSIRGYKSAISATLEHKAQPKIDSGLGLITGLEGVDWLFLATSYECGFEVPGIQDGVLTRLGYGI
jgi:hypothetical protein